MKASEDSFLLPSASGVESWRMKGKEGAVAMEPGKLKKPDWIALPMRQVVSVPMRFPAMDPSRREAAAQLELEGMGLNQLTSEDFDLHLHDAGQREQRAWITAQVGQIPDAWLDGGMESRFAPSVCFRQLKRGEVTVWPEGGALVAAVPDEHGQPLHAQALTARHADEDAAAELRCVLAALDLAGIGPEVSEVVVQSPADASPGDLGDFARAVDMPVSTEVLPAPHAPTDAWRLVPPLIVQRRAEQRQRQTFFLASAAALLVLLVMVGTFALRLWSRERAVIADSAKLAALKPELDTIRAAQNVSLALDNAFNRDKSASELYFQVAKHLPEEGIRLESFEITPKGEIVLRGEASNQQFINRLRDDLTAEPAFEGLIWDVPVGTPKSDNKFSFNATCSPPAPAEDTSTS